MAGQMPNGLQNSLFYPSIKIRPDDFEDAIHFYQAAFGAVVEERVVVEVPAPRHTYFQLRRTVYMRFNSNTVFRISEAPIPRTWQDDNNSDKCFYVDHPAQVVQQAVNAGAVISETQHDVGGNHVTVVRDPFDLHWVIGRNNLVPDLHHVG